MDTSYIPDNSGIYIFKDSFGTIIYVGKAINLKNRVNSYFRDTEDHNVKTKKLITQIKSIDYIITQNEEEALIKENEFIKKFQPKYNILLRDDKTYPYIKINIQENFPRIILTRKLIHDGSVYFGPYPNVKEARNIVEHLINTFKLRQCGHNLEKPLKRPCINFQLKKCYAPCVGNITPEKYREFIKQSIDFLQGKQKDIVNDLKQKMLKYSDSLQFELAGQARDMLKAAESVKTIASIKKNIDINKILLSLKEKLGLKNIPDTIEAFDISNTSGENAVGSMVVFKKGVSAKSFYRRFKIKTIIGSNDMAMMKEVFLRRYKRVIKENKDLPDLIVIDGGLPQLSLIKEAVEELSLAKSDIIGLAKRFELIYKLGSSQPIILNKHTDEIQLLQRIRDEAHRFAITYHKKIRQEKFIRSELHDIPGIGEKKALSLLKHFGSLKAIKQASVEELKKVVGITKKNVERIKTSSDQ